MAYVLLIDGAGPLADRSEVMAALDEMLLGPGPAPDPETWGTSATEAANLARAELLAGGPAAPRGPRAD